MNFFSENKASSIMFIWGVLIGCIVCLIVGFFISKSYFATMHELARVNEFEEIGRNIEIINLLEKSEINCAKIALFRNSNSQLIYTKDQISEHLQQRWLSLKNKLENIKEIDLDSGRLYEDVGESWNNCLQR